MNERFSGITPNVCVLLFRICRRVRAGKSERCRGFYFAVSLCLSLSRSNFYEYFGVCLVSYDLYRIHRFRCRRRRRRFSVLPGWLVLLFFGYLLSVSVAV